MAASGMLLSEERFMCSVCLDVFTEPVSTPCGHNFCTACVNAYWNSNDICQCPLCKKLFPERPELHVNTVLSELAAEVKALVQVEPSTPDPELPGTADVLCDMCCERQEKAVKSCLMCLVSFCEAHLEPHRRIAVLKSHTLLDPVKNLEDRMCTTHNKTIELYCRTDGACVCVLCFKDDHKSHTVVPLEEEYEAAMAEKDAEMEKFRKVIQSRAEKVAEVENSIDVSQMEAEREKDSSVWVFADLIRSLQRNQDELVGVIEERHAATKRKAEASVAELRMEIAELESRRNQLELLAQSEDHHHFLQSFPGLCSPRDRDRPGVGAHSDLSFEALRGDVALLKQRADEIMEKIPEIKIKRMREHAVDLTFDPDTAFCSLVISQDGKQVTEVDKDQKPPKNPKRFEICPELLAKEGFVTGKFYYEVQVTGKTDWILGVVRESVNRKENMAPSQKNGFWTIQYENGKCISGTRSVTMKEKPQKMGIYVDYDEGSVSFYDVNSKAHLYSITGIYFTEKLYPYFCLEGSMDGTNSAPLIITPVSQTH